MSQVGIGVDIAEVINELGTSITFPERDPAIPNEKIDYESNSQMTKPFTAEHFLNSTFVYNSAVEPGDLVKILATQIPYRVMNVFNEVFEDAITHKQCILYKCNEVVSIFSQEEVRNPVDYSIDAQWVRHTHDLVTLIADKLYSSRLDDYTVRFIEIEIKGRVMYVPNHVRVLPKDRVLSKDGTKYAVTITEDHTFPGMNLVYLEEDTRHDNYAPDPIP